jgi:hypothetical protein
MIGLTSQGSADIEIIKSIYILCTKKFNCESSVVAIKSLLKIKIVMEKVLEEILTEIFKLLPQDDLKILSATHHLIGFVYTF